MDYDAYDIAEKVQFALDSSLEEAGFEPSVPRQGSRGFDLGYDSTRTSRHYQPPPTSRYSHSIADVLRPIDKRQLHALC